MNREPAPGGVGSQLFGLDRASRLSAHRLAGYFFFAAPLLLPPLDFRPALLFEAELEALFLAPVPLDLVGMNALLPGR